jgi:hypothetical protein
MYSVDFKSHFWSSTEMFLNFMNAVKNGLYTEFDGDTLPEYIIRGFKNARKQGYVISRPLKTIEREIGKTRRGSARDQVPSATQRARTPQIVGRRVQRPTIRRRKPSARKSVK